MQPVRIGLIGGGAISAAHIRAIEHFEGGQLVAICDVDAEREQLADALGVSFFSDHRDLVEMPGLEAVVNSTPNTLHAEIGIACANKGLHLLTEKPIATTLADGKRLVEATRESGIKHLVGHHRRHYPLVQRAREIVRSGQLGELLAAEVMWAIAKPDEYFNTPWRTQPGGGPILINHIHDIDNLRFIFGEIETVTARVRTSRQHGVVEDTAAMLFEFENGAIGTGLISDSTPSPWAYEVSSGEDPLFTRNHTDCYRFLGTQASLSFPRLEIWTLADPERGWWGPLDHRTLGVAHRDPIHAQMEHFCRVIRDLEEPLITAEDGLRSLAAAIAIHESSQRGIPVSPADLIAQA